MANEIVKLPESQTIGAMAEIWAKSGFGGLNTSQAGALLLMAQAEGKHPFIAMQEYDVIKGRPALKSSAVLARFRAAGGIINWIETTNEKAVCEAKIGTGEQQSKITIEWTIDKARQAKIYRDGSGWTTYPAAMLRARAQVEAIRAIAPETLSGQYVAEEVQYFDDKGQSPKPGATQAEVIKTEPTDEQRAKLQCEFAACVKGNENEVELLESFASKTYEEQKRMHNSTKRLLHPMSEKAKSTNVEFSEITDEIPH